MGHHLSLSWSLLLVGACTGSRPVAAPTAITDAEYTRQGYKAEANIQLNSIAKSAKSYFVHHQTYPIGTAVASPEGGCCAYPNQQCPVGAAQWDGVWQQLEVRVDEPHRFRYSYESMDGKTFTVNATADVTCDGREMILTAYGEIINGQPATNIVTTKM